MKNILIAFLICFVSINSYAETYTKRYCESDKYREYVLNIMSQALTAAQVLDFRGACSLNQKVIIMNESCKPYWKPWQEDFNYKFQNSTRLFCACANNPNAQACRQKSSRFLDNDM